MRDDERVCAFLDVYFRRIDVQPLPYVRAAAALLDAPDDDGDVQDYIERGFEDAMTDVYVFDELHILDVLRGMFVQELSSVLSHGLDVFFINAPDDELHFWRDTLGARKVGHFIAASGARPLPIYAASPRARGSPSAPRSGSPRRAE